MVLRDDAMVRLSPREDAPVDGSAWGTRRLAEEGEAPAEKGKCHWDVHKSTTVCIRKDGSLWVGPAGNKGAGDKDKEGAGEKDKDWRAAALAAATADPVHHHNHPNPLTPHHGAHKSKTEAKNAAEEEKEEEEEDGNIDRSAGSESDGSHAAGGAYKARMAKRKSAEGDGGSGDEDESGSDSDKSHAAGGAYKARMAKRKSAADEGGDGGDEGGGDLGDSEGGAGGDPTLPSLKRRKARLNQGGPLECGARPTDDPLPGGFESGLKGGKTAKSVRACRPWGNTQASKQAHAFSLFRAEALL